MICAFISPPDFPHQAPHSALQRSYFMLRTDHVEQQTSRLTLQTPWMQYPTSHCQLQTGHLEHQTSRLIPQLSILQRGMRRWQQEARRFPPGKPVWQPRMAVRSCQTGRAGGIVRPFIHPFSPAKSNQGPVRLSQHSPIFCWAACCHAGAAVIDRLCWSTIMSVRITLPLSKHKNKQ